MKVLVIGAGPAGLMCAYQASLRGHNVTIIEKNEKAGKKIYITGKGRCNITNDCNEVDFIKNVVSNPKFMYSAINAFSCSNTIEFFESRNVPLVVERGNRVFPKSYHASDITKALLEACKEVDIHLNEVVKHISKENDEFIVITNKGEYVVDKVVIATGGVSYPTTGSTGDGYSFAKCFGHNIIDPVPGLNGLIVKEKIPSTLKDFTLKNVSLIAKYGNKTIEEFGELTFLSNGLGGPISLTVSSLINRYQPKEVKLYVDLKPPLSFETLDTRIIKDIAKKPNVTYISFLRGFMPAAIIPLFLEKSKIPADKMMHSLTIEERRVMVSTLKGLEFNFVSLDKIDRAIITAGGINVKEVNAKTLESKLVSGLYFAGEVLDVDAFTGGFNMQIALSTGYLAGNSI